MLIMGLMGLILFNLGEITSASPLTQLVNCCTVTQETKPLGDNNFPPYIWPTQGFISRGFSTVHEGIDISEEFGTPILAAGNGEVIFSGQDDWGLGLVVQLRHSNGSVTVYGHNQRLLVRKGQQVSQGQVIAEMGSTGNSNGPHLHFEVHPNGNILSGAVNPLPFLPPLVGGQITRSRPVAVTPRKPKPTAYEWSVVSGQ
jgi:lysostaphin